MALGRVPWPRWIVGWLVLSSLVVVWDIGFVLCRPASMAGGSWSWLWAPYSNYYRVDLAYGDLNNHWIRAQTYGNIVEVILNYSSVALHLSSSHQRQRLADVLLMNVAMMTFWKTVLYWVIEACSSFENTRHNGPFDAIFIFIIPNSLWILVPFLIISHMAQRFLHSPIEAATKVE